MHSTMFYIAIGIKNALNLLQASREIGCSMSWRMLIWRESYLVTVIGENDFGGKGTEVVKRICTGHPSVVGVVKRQLR